MDDPISVRYAWNIEILIEAWAAHQRSASSRVGRFVRYLGMLFYLVLSFGIPSWLLFDHRSPPETRRNAFLALIFVTVLWASLVVLIRKKSFLRWRAQRVFRSEASDSEVVEWSFGSTEISNRTDNAASTILWPLFVKAVEDRRGFLLYASIQLFHWIPAFGFASEGEMKRFAALARSRVANYIVVGECQFPAKPDPVGLEDF